MDQFIIFLLGSFAVTLCVIFAMERRSRRISLAAGITTLATVIATVASIYYTVKQLERWNNEDRPRVVTLPEPSCLPDNKCGFAVTNTGTEDATGVEVQVASRDLLHTHYTLLPQDGHEISRISRGFGEHVTMQVDNDTSFLVVCIKYKNVQGTPFADAPPNFYTMVDFLPGGPGPKLRKASLVAAASEYAKLSKGFSCADLEPRATKQPRP